MASLRRACPLCAGLDRGLIRERLLRANDQGDRLRGRTLAGCPVAVAQPVADLVDADRRPGRPGFAVASMSRVLLDLVGGAVGESCPRAKTITSSKGGMPYLA